MRTHPVLTYEATTTASPRTAWRLMAEPARWRSWAPHLRGAWGLGRPEVRAGASGAVLLLGLPLVPARITDKKPGRSWAWRVGPADLVHRVERRGRGSLVAVDISAPAALEAVIRVSYGPLVALLMRNLARVAAAEERRG